MAEDYTDYITQGAIARGLDPKAALRTVDTEGGRSGKVGDSGTSFGPFQMHVGGTAPGTTAKGLGDAMLAQGLNPRDPYQSIDFALDYAKAHGGTFSPDIWHGLRGGAPAPGEHRWVGDVSGGGAQPLYLGKLEKNFHQPTGNDLLDALINLNVPKEDKTGNPLLDQLMQQAMLGAGPANQAQPVPDAAKALGRTSQALPPETVPELSGQQVDIKPMQPLQSAAIAPPTEVTPLSPSNRPTNEIEKINVANDTISSPAFQPGAAPRPFDTGNGLLDRILKQLSPISTAQAGELPIPVPKGEIEPPVKLEPGVPADPDKMFKTIPLGGGHFLDRGSQGLARGRLAIAQRLTNEGWKYTDEQGWVSPQGTQDDRYAMIPSLEKAKATEEKYELLRARQEAIPGEATDITDQKALSAPPGPLVGTEPGGLPSGAGPSDIIQNLIDWRKSGGLAGMLGMQTPEQALAKTPPIKNPADPKELARLALDPRNMDIANIMAGIGPGEMGGRIEPPPMGWRQLPDGAWEHIASGAEVRPALKDDPSQGYSVDTAGPVGVLYASTLDAARKLAEQYAPKLGRPAGPRPPLSPEADAAREAFNESLIPGHEFSQVPFDFDKEAPSEPLAPKQPEISPPATPPGASSEGTQARSETAQPPIRPPPPGETAPPAPLTPPPDGNGPVIAPPTLPDKKTLKVIRQKVQDGLNWIARSRSADAIEAKQFIDSLPPEFQDPGFRARVGRDIERRMIDPNVELHPDTQRFLDLPQVKKWTDEEHALGTRLRKRLTSDQADELGVEPPLRTVGLGHVHRMIKGRAYRGEIMPEVDPLTGRPRAFGGRSMSTSAAGMKHRSNRFVGQDDAGNRVPSKNRLGEKPPPLKNGYTRFYSDGQGGWVKDRDTIRKRHPTGITTLYTDFPTLAAEQFKVGDSYNLPHNPERSARIAPPEKYGDRYRVGQTDYTAREPTMTEIEDNPLPGELPIRYHDDYLLGLVNNVNRMRSVERNLNLLEQYKTELGGAGLWHPMAGRYLHSPPSALDARGQPFNYKQVDLPQLHGWAHPRIADTINDLYRRGGEQDTLDRINHVLIGSMFLLPVGHMRNVGMHYTIGRGLDWAYRNPQLLRAFNEVWHMGPVYQKFIRNNGPAMYPGAADVHGKLVEKLLHDMANDPGWEITAKSLGTTMKNLLPALYKWSARTLWMTNDFLFLARSLENLKRYGHADPMAAPDSAWKQAIAHTKREIPPYEVPDRILGNRGLRRLLMSPVFAFGRYTYDKYRILGENVKEMAGVYGKGMPQIEGAAKALLTLMLAFPVTSALNAALQWATGNENAKVYGAGPTTLIRAVGGGLGKMAGVDPDSTAGWMLGMTPGEADFSHALAGILTFTPGLDALVRWFGGGHDPYTGQPIIGQQATPRGIAAQSIEALMGMLYPGELALQGFREGPGALTEPLGFNLAGPQGPSGKALRLQRGLERGRERRSGVQQILDPVFDALGMP